MRPVYRSTYEYPNKIGIIDDNGRYSYKSLLLASTWLANRLLKSVGCDNLSGKRVVYLCNQDVTYIIAQWACWLNSSICVPLCQDHPAKVLEYYIEDSKASAVMCTENFETILQPLAIKFNIPLIKIMLEDLKSSMNENVAVENIPEVFSNNENDALIIYTSGTTGLPKGVVHTTQTLKAHMNAMIKAWDWKVSDCIVNVLPLHHVHGIINCIMTSLYNGSTLIMETKFSVKQTWDYLLNYREAVVTVFMAVPTIYTRLVDEYKNLDPTSDQMTTLRERCMDHMRLFVSGSAALPESLFEQWKQLTGFEILEQYGMSEYYEFLEAGRILSNQVTGKKVPGRVGLPMPDIQIRVVQRNDDNRSEKILIEGTRDKLQILEGEQENKYISGELFVRGPTLFTKYFNKQEATIKAFDKDNFFATGDMVEYEVAANTFKVLGRISADIIKSGGYKISALDVERVLLYHPCVKECIVIGVPNLKWGESVTAVIVRRQESDDELDLAEVRRFCKEYLPAYSCPTNMVIVDYLERNAVGKINKKELRQKLFPA